MVGSVTRLCNLLDFGQPLKPLATIHLAKSPTFLGNFFNGVKIYHFSSEIIFGQLLKTFGDFVLVTLVLIQLFDLFLSLLFVGSLHYLSHYFSDLLLVFVFLIIVLLCFFYDIGLECLRCAKQKYDYLVKAFK